MLVGEPGIGKTRIADELTTYARLRKAQVLWGRCYEAAGAPPYWPFVQALRGYVREHDPEQLRRELGSSRRRDRRDRAGDRGQAAQPPDAADRREPAQARFRLFDSVTAFLMTASADQPIVLVLDDLHWADAGTLALLEFLARELEGARLLILGTYRDVELTRGHPLAATLAELSRERLFERITLRGLDADDVGRFIGTNGRDESAGSPGQGRLQPYRGQPPLRDRGRAAARPGGRVHARAAGRQGPVEREHPRGRPGRHRPAARAAFGALPGDPPDRRRRGPRIQSRSADHADR